MYHSMTYADEAILEEDKGKMTVHFWQPVMRKGVIDFPKPEECTIKRHIRKMGIKPFGKKQENFSRLAEENLAWITGGMLSELDE